MLGQLADRTLAFFVENFPSLDAIAVGGPIGFAWTWACLYCAGYLKVRRGLKTGYTMSVVSLFVGMTLAPGMEFAPSFFLLLPAIGFACACVEAASPHGWDNATMQVVPTMLVKWLR